ncbi:PKD domain-containing protein [Haladaptatus sp. ZSTT2]|uniref:PKD domain-containing protein n=1 Tax=Haladaptatus sp. ZSTT2 TaxID=3120515 RepID=UPI00300F4B32
MAGVALGGASLIRATGSANAATRESFLLLEGTEHETEVFVTQGEADGPTVLVIGGIHGNETAGYEAAAEIAEWDIESGTLVTIPRANEVAISNDSRIGDGGDLNRQFPTGEEPTTALARAIWSVVEEYEPGTVLDLHESQEIYDGSDLDGVGQTVFHSDGETATRDAEDAVNFVNNNYIDDSTYNFKLGGFSSPDTDPSGLFVHKAARDAGADSFLVETLSTDIALDTRIEWHSVITRRVTGEELFAGDESTPTPTPEPEPKPEPPTAKITTDPANATDVTLEEDTTVQLDASGSEAGSSEIVKFAWDLTGDGATDATGAQTSLTLGECQKYPIVLTATDAEGMTDTTEITLSTL